MSVFMIKLRWSDGCLGVGASRAAIDLAASNRFVVLEHNARQRRLFQNSFALLDDALVKAQLGTTNAATTKMKTLGNERIQTELKSGPGVSSNSETSKGLTQCTLYRLSVLPCSLE
jgi:hypothetical protein